jgi:hypothetical protein
LGEISKKLATDEIFEEDLTKTQGTDIKFRLGGSYETWATQGLAAMLPPPHTSFHSCGIIIRQ